MVDDDNMPAVENIPQQDTTNNNNNNNHIMLGWEHSGSCERRSAIRTNATPMLKSLNTSDEVPIIPKTNANLGGGGGGGGGEGKVTYGEFLHWLGLWFLMGTVVGP